MARNQSPEVVATRNGCCAALATLFNVAGGAGVNLFAPVKVGETASAVRVCVSLAATAILSVAISDGTTTFVTALNSGVAVPAGQLFTFVFNARRFSTQTGQVELSYSLQLSAAVTVQYLGMDEVQGAAL
jgi:hypothetical protein